MIKNKFPFLCAIALCVVVLTSCNDKRVKQAQDIVINEIMASNRTGLSVGSGKPADWIELKNNGKDSINLEGFQLCIIKEVPDSMIESGEEPEDMEKSWEFPNVSIGPGECMVIFAKKVKEGKQPKALTANFKLPKDGGTLQFLAPNGSVIKELEYDKLSADQSLARQEDGTYQKTYWQSPGFDNNREGYEKAMVQIDSKRTGPLLIWELMSRAPTSSENWVKLKNVSDQELDLAGYSLAKKMDKEDTGWALPSRKLQPGEILTIQLTGNQGNNPTQTNFKLGKAETIILMKDGKFVDGMCAKNTPIGASIGRADDKKGFFFYSTPTKDEQNTSAM